MSRKRDEPGTFELLTKLPQQIVTLAKIEYENAKREAVAAAKKAGIGAAGIIVALFFVFFAAEALVIAAIAALAIVWPWWLAALTVAFALLALAAGAILAGVALVKRGNPVPEETLGRVGGDMTALSEVKFNSGPSDRVSGARERGTTSPPSAAPSGDARNSEARNSGGSTSSSGGDTGSTGAGRDSGGPR